MLEVLKIVPPSPEQWEIVVEGARNPMNSWDRMDSYVTYVENPDTANTAAFQFVMGENDEALLRKLVRAGTDHGKFLRQLPVIMTINAPRYWWTEMDTYKIGTTANSCSTMHKLHSRPITLRDFSGEDLDGFEKMALADLITVLNMVRGSYIKRKELALFRGMVQLLPQSYNQRRTWSGNYQVLRNVYHARGDGHKVTEWQTFREVVERLPYSFLITEKM